MANASTNSNVISKNNSGFPDYLDFDVLRSSAIEYLGGLTGRIWTDYNVHDPGITILEVLCYALLDLGYRTHLPAIDIFAAGETARKNFFTPSRILSCNPLTIADLRKMLIDVEGVRNAWLKVAEEVEAGGLCDATPAGEAAVAGGRAGYAGFLNGLYHIYLELDDTAGRPEKDVLSDVREAVQAHRNFCEDFTDITVLCRLETGICADIELEKNADADDVYKNMVLALQNFFSPAPRFYTLQQLLDKGKPMEEIFAGRPYAAQSHGFVDTAEFEQITLKKEVHVSDAYRVLQTVTGIKTVRKLQLRLCDQELNSGVAGNWQYRIPENHILSFSLACSGFTFSRNGIRVPVDVAKNAFFFQINLHNTGKVWQPSDNLDVKVAAGIYHQDLDSYYSVQNEFPRVYGIGAGGLSEAATAGRKAQAYQLKGFLLFFDQLLADYLTQLKNIPALFSPAAPDTGNRHTYFNNTLDSVPDLDKLLRHSGERNQTYTESYGTVVAYPVNKKEFLSRISPGATGKNDPENGLPPYLFNTTSQRDVAIALLQNDFNSGTFQAPVIYSTKEGGIFYYLITSSDEFVLAGKKEFKTKADAENAISLFPLIGTCPENYSGYFDSRKDAFSFDIELKLASYQNYLRKITEDKALYQTRRNGFLDHLLSRFAEQFTDFALLSYGFAEPARLEAEVVKNKERYLSRYDEISRDRGKAFNYTGCHDGNNRSGFEKRWRALAGISDRPGDTLCNFEVVRYEDTYSVKLQLQNFHLLKAGAAYEGIDEASKAVQAMFTALSDRAAYATEFLPHEKAYQVTLTYGADQEAAYPELFAGVKEAEEVIDTLHKMFVREVQNDEIIISKYLYQLQLTDSGGNSIRLSADRYENEQDAFAASLGSLKQINDEARWVMVSGDRRPSGKFIANSKKRPEKFIDLDAFKIDINNNIVEKPDKFSYELLDKKNTFKFRTLLEFDNERQARLDAYQLLMLLADAGNYTIEKEADRYKIYVLNNGRPVAESSAAFSGEDSAGDFRSKVQAIVNQHYYLLTAIPVPYRWKFIYRLGFEKNYTLLFESDEAFETRDAAVAAARQFKESVNDYRIEIINGRFTLTRATGEAPALTCTFSEEGIVQEDNDTKLNQAKSFLALRQEITSHQLGGNPAAFRQNVEMDDISKTGQYVYRLVDKDNLRAFHAAASEADALESVKTLYNNALEGYAILDICLGGDIAESSAGKTKNASYHYLIKCRRDIGPLKDGTVLFKSTAGYAGLPEAEAAFEAHYLAVLNKASDADNYGPGKYISLNEAETEDAGASGKRGPVVFVPETTQAVLGADEAERIGRLVKMAKSYPVRMVTPGSDGFKKLYPGYACDAGTLTEAGKELPAEPVYYFVLYNAATDVTDWQSVSFFDTAAAARQQFYFFTLLLRYRGNYFIEKDYCDHWKIYIREVLAESSQRFDGEATAWGEEGVRKFICISQSQDAFHAYANKKGGTYGYYVACAGTAVFHPCKYDTAERRDKAIEDLYSHFKDFHSENLFRFVREEEKTLLYGLDQKPVAIVYDTVMSGRSECEKIVDLLQTASAGTGYYTGENGKFFLGVLSGQSEIRKIAEPVDGSVTLDQWKEQWLTLAYYYPLIRQQGKYCIAIRLPGWNARDNDPESRYPCGCGDSPPAESGEACYLAWKGSCCFSSCSQAAEAYRQAEALLADYASYQPFFDCVCHSYGIALHTPADRVAVSPQQYTATDMVCEAMERSRQLINAEGLHVVEHILLRPRCENDCTCHYYTNRNFTNPTRCDDFFWHQGEAGDRENPARDIAFIPGADPFSFIATVALPAWPERFRRKENRLLLENMLYREAPAHVLLRILWLTPDDLCRFEGLYKEWKIWLSQKAGCDKHYCACDLLTFLFKAGFDDLADCDACNPCEEDTVTPPVCAEDELVAKSSRAAHTLLTQVNALFGWEGISCREPEVPPQVVGEDQAEGKPETKAPGGEPVAAVVGTGPGTAVPAAAPDMSLKKKTSFVNSRLTRYRKNIARILDDSNGNPVAGKIDSLLRENNPSAEKVNSLVAEVLVTAEAAGNEEKALAAAQKEELVRNLLWFYLDKVVFNGYDISKIQSLAAGLQKLGEAGFDRRSLWDGWEPDAVGKFQPGIDFGAMRDLLAKNNQ